MCRTRACEHCCCDPGRSAGARQLASGWPVGADAGEAGLAVVAVGALGARWTGHTRADARRAHPFEAPPSVIARFTLEWAGLTAAGDACVSSGAEDLGTAELPWRRDPDAATGLAPTGHGADREVTALLAIVDDRLAGPGPVQAHCFVSPWRSEPG